MRSRRWGGARAAGRGMVFQLRNEKKKGAASRARARPLHCFLSFRRECPGTAAHARHTPGSAHIAPWPPASRTCSRTCRRGERKRGGERERERERAAPQWPRRVFVWPPPRTALLLASARAPPPRVPAQAEPTHASNACMAPRTYPFLRSPLSSPINRLSFFCQGAPLPLPRRAPSSRPRPCRTCAPTTPRRQVRDGSRARRRDEAGVESERRRDDQKKKTQPPSAPSFLSLLSLSLTSHRGPGRDDRPDQHPHPHPAP